MARLRTRTLRTSRRPGPARARKPNPVRLLSKFALGLALLWLLPGVVWAFPTLWPGWGVAAGSWLKPLALGTAAGVLFDLFVARRHPRLEVFEHELTHALAALLMLHRIHGFVATRRGGAVSHSGHGLFFAEAFIGLAPYVLPTFTAILVFLRPLLGPGWFPWYDALLGLTLGFHTSSTLRETVSNYSTRRFLSAIGREFTVTDIAKQGFLFSAVYIATVSLAVHGLLFGVLVGGYGGVPAWAGCVWRITTAPLRAVF